MPALLFAQSTTPPDVGRIVLVVALLLAFLLIGAVVILKLRRAVMGDQSNAAGTPLTLADLRAMHARGDLDDDEFERARAAIIGGATGRPTPRKPSE